MVGGLLQITAYGAQDVYLTNNPQITFFKTVYRRHTNFSIEAFEHTVQDNPNFGTSNEVIIPRLGDLMTKMYLKITISGVTPPADAKFAWVRRLGHAIINFIEINIGGATIDRQTGIWLDIWYELTRSGDHDRGYAKIIGDVPELTTYNTNPKLPYTMFIPLKFWFNRHVGLALPIVGIQYHQIIIKMNFNEINNLIVRNDAFTDALLPDITIDDVGVLVDYIFVDEIERKTFALVSSDYLIEQVQFTGEESIQTKIELTNIFRTQLHFNHPTKELIWAMRNGNYTIGAKFLCYTHLDNWNCILEQCAGDILENSILLLQGPEYDIDAYGNQIIISPGVSPPDAGTWEEIEPSSTGQTSNNKITVTNNSMTDSLWINTSSLLVGTYNLVDKINATIQVSDNGTIIIKNVSTTLTIRDISIPVSFMTDTRIASDDVCVNMFSNYGVLIDGSINPIEYSLLEYNDQCRFNRRNGIFFNYLQPEMHHSNTPKDGINVYSFAVKPEDHQPTGTSNLSEILKILFTLWIRDLSQQDSLPNLNITNIDTRIYIFAFSYNILRVDHGLAALSYNG